MSTCTYCGCTDAHACPEGCCWVDAGQTICSACLPQLPLEVLYPLYAREMDAAAEVPMTVILLPVALVAIVGQIQLALRHPENTGPTSEPAQEFINGVRQHFHGYGFPVILESIRRGGEPACDAAPGQEFRR